MPDEKPYTWTLELDDCGYLRRSDGAWLKDKGDGVWKGSDGVWYSGDPEQATKDFGLSGRRSYHAR